MCVFLRVYIHFKKIQGESSVKMCWNPGSVIRTSCIWYYNDYKMSVMSDIDYKMAVKSDLDFFFFIYHWNLNLIFTSLILQKDKQRKFDTTSLMLRAK